MPIEQDAIDALREAYDVLQREPSIMNLYSVIQVRKSMRLAMQGMVKKYKDQPKRIKPIGNREKL